MKGENFRNWRCPVINDFDWEVLQKKRLAKQAKYVKRGSRSKKCSLPSDRITRKEWNRMNGEIATYNLNRPMDWKTFKSMSIDLQREYILKLREKYNATCKQFAQLFGVGYWAVYEHVAGTLKITGGAKHKMSDSDREAWEKFVTNTKKLATNDYESEEGNTCFVETEDISTSIEKITSKGIAIDDSDAAEESNDSISTMHMDSMTFTFSGKLNAEAVYNSIKTALTDNPEGTICIEIQFVKE